jgi:hypothetical protein
MLVHQRCFTEWSRGDASDIDGGPVGTREWERVKRPNFADKQAFDISASKFSIRDIRVIRGFFWQDD